VSLTTTPAHCNRHVGAFDLDRPAAQTATSTPARVATSSRARPGRRRPVDTHERDTGHGAQEPQGCVAQGRVVAAESGLSDRPDKLAGALDRGRGQAPAAIEGRRQERVRRPPERLVRLLGTVVALAQGVEQGLVDNGRAVSVEGHGSTSPGRAQPRAGHAEEQ
jgi:hypothetical protein